MIVSTRAHDAVSATCTARKPCRLLTVYDPPSAHGDQPLTSRALLDVEACKEHVQTLHDADAADRCEVCAHRRSLHRDLGCIERVESSFCRCTA